MPAFGLLAFFVYFNIEKLGRNGTVNLLFGVSAPSSGVGGSS